MIGIPYPNLKDTNVELKMEYNNVFSGSHGLLTGDKWYTLQAFRGFEPGKGKAAVRLASCKILSQ